MKKILSLLAISAFIFISCKQDKVAFDDQYEVISSSAEYMINLKPEKEDLLLIDFFKCKELITNLTKDAINNKIDVYDYFDNKKQVSKEEIEFEFDAHEQIILVEDVETEEMKEVAVKGEIQYNEISHLLFLEEWRFDENEFNLSKRVKGIAPIRSYTKEREDGNKIAQRVPFIYLFEQSSSNEMELLSKHVEYIVSMNSKEDELPLLEEFNTNEFVEMIVDKVLSNKVKPYSYPNIKEIPIKLVNRALGAKTDTSFNENMNGNITFSTERKTYDLSEIKELLFIEEWYYNPQIYTIQKIVKGVGFIRHDTKTDSTKVLKSIPFVVMFHIDNEA